MAERILQSCYTNASYDVGGKISSGWQSVSVSDDIPKNAYNACVGFQNKNSNIQKEMLDEYGNTLNLLEIIGDGEYAYVIRTQYGLKDRLGRANMFSHAFVFSWKDKEVLEDPNILVAIDKSNFKDNEDEANIIPTSLSRYSNFDIESALNMSGLGFDEYLNLIRCVYAQMTEKNILDPLFIQYDGTEDQMKAIIYCIYYGMPHYLRKRLSIASNTSGNDSDKNVIFSINAKTKVYYFIPSTGENNILSARIEKKIERYGFVDYVVKNLDKIDSYTYFDTLDDLAVDLGDMTSSNELVLKIAHKYMLTNGESNGYTRDELEGMLSDTLRLKSSKCELLEKFITNMLNEAIRRKLVLTDEMQENLDAKLALAETTEFKNIGEKYNIYYFSTLEIDKAAKKLGQMDRNKFKTYTRYLGQTEDGLNILNYYYINIVLKNNDISWDELNKTLDEISDISSKVIIEDRVEALAWDVYCKELKSKVSAKDAYKNYMTLMKRLISSNKIEECSNVAKVEYWNLFNYSDFSMKAESEYSLMNVGEESKECKIILSLIELLKSVSGEADDILLYRNYFKANNLNNTNKSVVINCINRELNKKYKTVSMQDTRWIEVSSIVQSEKLIKILVELYDFLNLNIYERLTEKICEIINFPQTLEPDLRKILDKISDIVLDFIKDNDSEKNVVPLDIWLLLGVIKYDNPFYIFDRYKPSILNQDDVDVIRNSTLISSDEYINAGEKYVKEKGTELKRVKVWLSEMKKKEKNNTKNNNKLLKSHGVDRYETEEDSDSPNIFGKLISFIVSKIRGQKDTEYIEEYLQEDDNNKVRRTKDYKSRGKKN